MAYFGKKFKVYGSSTELTSPGSSSTNLNILSNMVYIKDVDIFFPTSGTTPSILSFEDDKLFDNRQQIINSTAQVFDGLTVDWQIYGTVVNNYDNVDISGILSYFPYFVEIKDYPTLVLTQDDTQRAIIIANHANPYMVVTTDGSQVSTPMPQMVSGRTIKMGADNWDRFYFAVTFYYNNYGYYYDIGNSYSASYGWRVSTRPSSANVVNTNFFANGSDDYRPSPITPVDTDPFAPGGTSEPGGGNGTFNGTSDSNPIPGDPSISATDTGFMTVFATNTAGLRALANSLWTDIFSAIQPGGSLEGTVEALKNIVASPYDAILGCHIVPVNVPVGTSRNVKMYGVLPSSVSLPVASSQWVHKDCGSLTIQPYDGSYLDYAPYSKVTSLYLPFVGVVSVDIDIIMNTTIGVYYKIDIISGQCIVYVTKDNNVYFQYQGQCAVPIPVTSIDWSNTVSSGLGLIGSVTNIVGSAVGGALAGGPAGALSGAVTGTIGQAGSMAQNVMNSKPDIKAGSGVGGAAALLGCKSPYLIIERPRKSTPKNQNHYTGYPSNIRAKLGTMEGYTEVSRVYVNHMSATTEEKAEIERLLNDGVVFPKRNSN